MGLYALKETNRGTVIAYFRNEKNANHRLDQILEKKPWAIDFLTVEPVPETIKVENIAKTAMAAR